MEQEVDICGSNDPMKNPAFDFQLVLRSNKIFVAGECIDVPQEKSPLMILGMKSECKGQGCLSFSVATDKTSPETTEVGIVLRNICNLLMYETKHSRLNVLVLHLNENIAVKLLSHMKLKETIDGQMGIRKLNPAVAIRKFLFPLIDFGDGVALLTKKNGLAVDEHLSASQLRFFLQKEVCQKREFDLTHRPNRVAYPTDTNPRNKNEFFETLSSERFFELLESAGFTLDTSMENICPKVIPDADINPTESIKEFLNGSKGHVEKFLQKDFLQRVPNGLQTEQHNRKHLHEQQPMAVLETNMPNISINLQEPAQRASRKRCQEMTLDDSFESITPRKMDLKNMSDGSVSNASLLTYPSKGLDRITIVYHDMRTLHFDEMLNDTIVDFWMSYIKLNILEPESRDSVHLFSTFFYKKLTEKIDRRHLAKTVRSSELRFQTIAHNFKQISKWTRKVQIFSKNFIVIPVVEDLHWYLAIVYNPIGMVNMTEGPFENNVDTRKKGSSRSQPESFVIIFDSLADEDPKREVLVDVLRDYFELEFQDKRPFPGAKFERTRLGSISPANLPQQSNFIDCGLYILKYAESFLSKPPDLKSIQDFDWMKEYPLFSLDMNFCRETIRAKIRQLVPKNDWERFLTWEAANKFSPNPSTGESSASIQAKHEKGVLDRARRPRRYTELGMDQLPKLSRKENYFGNSISVRSAFKR
ncbi:unnamed protein product, partial [Mesorhabditis belari]|uniref:Ubiquitin-like protease family profile domain-containing protein n=1 Tax=Mesorhabditis belari TaxID=2138241 RepID=A0AAF3EU85_9BILA